MRRSEPSIPDDMNERLSLEETVKKWLALKDQIKAIVGAKKSKAGEYDSEFIDRFLEVSIPMMELEKQIEEALRYSGVIQNIRDPKVRSALLEFSREMEKKVVADLEDDQLDVHSDDDLADRAWDFVYSLGGPKEQFLSYLRVAPIIVGTEVPQRISDLMEEARTCFATGQIIAVVALGRMMLEVAISDIGERKGLISREQSLRESYRNYPPPPSTTADKLLGPKGSPRRRKFKDLYDQGSAVIHSKRDAGVSPLDYLKKVVEFVNNEYAINLRD